MSVPATIADVIVADFLQPTIERLSAQLSRNIELTVTLAFEGERVQRKICSAQHDARKYLVGEVRIAASDTAIKGRYKYNLQCVLPEEAALEGFSGIRLSGAVVLDGSVAKNDYSGFLYTYNEWDWGKKVRDV